MHRRPLYRLLDRYERQWPDERSLVERFRAFCGAHEDCLLRTCAEGHVTASAWILDADGGQALLTHHKKLGKWLQLGGHVDGEREVHLASLREAREESGMSEFVFVPWSDEVLTPLDLDVHEIPARAAEPAHLHWDFRFLLRAAPDQDLVISEESTDLAWAPAATLAGFTDEESVLRIARKAQQVTA